jgi:hypothetical protein
VINFDDIDGWAPRLEHAIKDYVPDAIKAAVAQQAPEFVEEARDQLLKATDRDAVIDAT